MLGPLRIFPGRLSVSRAFGDIEAKRRKYGELGGEYGGKDSGDLGKGYGKLGKEFWEPNAEGIKGGVEFGFTSTTVERAQALHYAQGTTATIFEMQMGLIDRGADLEWMSQYPHEKEVCSPSP